MRKLLLIGVVLLLVLTACNGAAEQSNPAKLGISVSILPQQWFLDRIGGDRVNTQAMVGSGDDPHTYEPTPQQMTNLASSKLYFTVGVEFEEVWLPRFESANPGLMVVDSAAGIERIAALNEHSYSESGTPHTGAETDPHIWFSPSRMKQMAGNMVEAMASADPQNADFYRSNYNSLLTEIEEVDEQVRQQLDDSARKTFMVVHPAWGYVAADYGLQMLAVEIGGSEPAPETLARIVELAQKYQINTLVVEKGSNIRLATSITKQAGIPNVVEWDPMAYDWPAAMKMIAETLHRALN